MLKYKNNILITDDSDNNRILVVDDNQSIHYDLKKILITDESPQRNEYNSLKEEIFGDDEDLLGNNTTINIPTYTYQIDSAFQGQEALKMVEKAESEGASYSLIFMDVRMPPGWDGIETISKIWEKFPNIEIVICSAYSDYPWEKIVEKLGTSDKLLFLEKPFATVEVQQMVLALVKKWNLGKKLRNYVDELEARVSHRTRQLENLLSNLKIAILLTEADGKIIFSNPLADEFFSEHKLLENSVLDILDPFSKAGLSITNAYKQRETLPVNYYEEKGTSIYKYTLLNLEGKHFVEPDPNILFLIEDVTDWHKKVNTDGFTGLWNQRYFKELLEKEIKKSNRYKNALSLIMIDVDHFKHFNDTYGYKIGDIILKALADILINLARETDIVARYAGEEFSVILPMTNEEGANIFAERVRQELENLIISDIFNKLIMPVTLSLGIASYEEGTTTSTFIEHADKALYYSKDNGRNCITSYSSLI